MTKNTKSALKKLLAVFLLEVVPIFLLSLAIPYVLSATSFPVDMKIYKIFGLAGVIAGWLKIREVLFLVVTEIFFTE